MSLSEGLSQRLNIQKQNNLYRKRVIVPSGLIDFSSNDYLGLSSDKRLLESFAEGDIDTYGSGSSSYINGYTLFHEKCEQDFSKAFGFDGALLFGSGFMANIGVIKALLFYL